LYDYFSAHFRLLGLVNGPGARDVPQGGLYIRRLRFELALNVVG
jgi:hypothetical protein